MEIGKKKKSIAAAFLIALLAVVSAGNNSRASDDSPVRVVDKVDIEKYMGLWYTISSIPQIFTRGCAGGTSAQYALRKDGDVDVYNSCFKEDGTVYDVKGKAWAAGPETNAKLKVSFVPYIKSDLLAGDYWIIGLGDNYEYAIVGHPQRKSGWILSRTRELPAVVMKEIKDTLIEEGYDYSRFKKVDQKGFPPPPEMD